MKHHIRMFLSAILLIGAFPFSGMSETQAFDFKKFEKGEYIMKHVAMCIICHTPKDKNGLLIDSQFLQGAPIPVKSPYEGQPWALKSANIAGLTAWSDEEAVHFLQTGLRPDGTYPDAPMPPFRMNEEDAEAVVTYLKNMNREKEP